MKLIPVLWRTPALSTVLRYQPFDHAPLNCSEVSHMPRLYFIETDDVPHLATLRQEKTKDTHLLCTPPRSSAHRHRLGLSAIIAQEDQTSSRHNHQLHDLVVDDDRSCNMRQFSAFPVRPHLKLAATRQSRSPSSYYSFCFRHSRFPPVWPSSS